MGGKKALSPILIVVGIIVLLLSLLADPLGIGGYPGFGYKQVIGAIAGVVVAVIGLILRRK